MRGKYLSKKIDFILQTFCSDVDVAQVEWVCREPVDSCCVLLFRSSACCYSELIVPSSWHLPITSYLRISRDFTCSEAVSQPSGVCCTVRRSFSPGTTLVGSSGGLSAGAAPARRAPQRLCRPALPALSTETGIFTRVHGFDPWPRTGAGVGLYLTTGFYILPLLPWP